MLHVLQQHCSTPVLFPVAERERAKVRAATTCVVLEELMGRKISNRKAGTMWQHVDGEPPRPLRWM